MPNAINQLKAMNKRGFIVTETAKAEGLPPVTEDDAGKVLLVDEDGKWNAGEIEGLPEVTEADNGSTLMVVDGQWVVAAQE